MEFTFLQISAETMLLSAIPKQVQPLRQQNPGLLEQL